MFTTVSLHWVNEGKFDEAMAVFKKNTELARKQEGFVSRQILVSQNDPLKITTATTWETRGQLDTWAKNPDRPRSPAGAPPRFSKIEMDVYEEVDVS